MMFKHRYPKTTKMTVLFAIYMPWGTGYAQPPTPFPTTKNSESGKSSAQESSSTGATSAQLPYTTYRFSPSTGPREQQLRCEFSNWGESPCVVGLVRGFLLSVGLHKMLFTQAVQSQITPGAWLYLGAGIGYQFLDGVDEKYSMTGFVGYQSVRFTDSSSRKVGAKGVTFSANYSQILENKLQLGFNIAGWQASNSFSSEVVLFDPGDRGAQSRALYKSFWEFEENQPNLMIEFPAAIDTFSWPSQLTGLNNPLKLYTKLSAFYGERTLSIEDNFTTKEKFFGLDLKGALDYCNSNPRAGAICGEANLGVRIKSAKKSQEPDGREDEKVTQDAKSVFPLISFSGSYQF